LIKDKITELKGYFEFVGLFFSYNAKTDFLKVIADTDGYFIKSETATGIYTYKDYLAIKRKETADNKDFNESLKRLFNNKNSDFIKETLESFLLKQGIKTETETAETETETA